MQKGCTIGKTKFKTVPSKTRFFSFDRQMSKRIPLASSSFRIPKSGAKVLIKSCRFASQYRPIVFNNPPHNNPLPF